MCDACSPPESREGRVAAEDICEGLLNEGGQVVDIEDKEAILALPRIEEQPDLKLTN